jgi:hypothetical protein
MANVNLPSNDSAKDFITVMVNVSLCSGANCNAGEYNVTYNGKDKLDIPVVTKNTVIRFKLDAATSANVFFVGMASSLASDAAQLSSYSISLDRRVLICTDIDSKDDRIGVTLQWIIGTPVSHDPQVKNTPGTNAG